MSESRSEFEAWFDRQRVSVGRNESAGWPESTKAEWWFVWQASRRAALEEAAKVAERGIGSGALSRIEEYRAKFIADELRELAGKTKEGQEP